MTEFYAYFEVTAIVTDRVGGVSEGDAHNRMPTATRVFQRLRDPHGEFPRLSSFKAKLVQVVPHFEAEEFANHAFMCNKKFDPPSFRGFGESKPEATSGHQYLWELESRLSLRCGHILEAPSRPVARRRADEMLERIAERGLLGIKVTDIAYAKVEALATRHWVPSELADRVQGATQ